MLNIIFDDFSICLLGYRTEFGCLYIPQGNDFIFKYFVLEVQINMYIFFILSESPSLNRNSFSTKHCVRSLRGPE